MPAQCVTEWKVKLFLNVLPDWIRHKKNAIQIAKKLCYIMEESRILAMNIKCIIILTVMQTLTLILTETLTPICTIIIIIIAEMAVFNVAGYLIEEQRRWPVITASPRDNIPNKFRILKERLIEMRKPYQLPCWTKNSSYYSAPVGDRTYDLPPP